MTPRLARDELTKPSSCSCLSDPCILHFTLVQAMPVSNIRLLHAYRHLYRQSHRAIKFSIPARYPLRQHLRILFRNGDANTFDQNKIDNTLTFLRHAEEVSGLEHKILKSLLRVWFWERPFQTQRNRGYPASSAIGDLANRLNYRSDEEIGFKYDTYGHMNHCIKMLNEDLNTCIPTVD